MGKIRKLRKYQKELREKLDRLEETWQNNPLYIPEPEAFGNCGFCGNLLYPEDVDLEIVPHYYIDEKIKHCRFCYATV